jgi:NAD(P)H-hydrate epimerase
LAGGDGLVAARHLHHFGYNPTIYYPKPSKPDLFVRLQTQLKSLSIPFTEDFQSSLKSTDFIIDAVFGFSFQPPVREPFPAVIQALTETSKPVLSVDSPSCWDVEGGPPEEGDLGAKFMPPYLISLTAAKPSVKYYQGTHFVGGRFLSEEMARRYDLNVPNYEGVDQIAKVPVDGSEGGKL